MKRPKRFDYISDMEYYQAVNKHVDQLESENTSLKEKDCSGNIEVAYKKGLKHGIKQALEQIENKLNYICYDKDMIEKMQPLWDLINELKKG